MSTGCAANGSRRGAWTDKDIPRLIGFNAEGCIYKDAQTAVGRICGRWYCKISADGAVGQLRGFDFVVLCGAFLLFLTAFFAAMVVKQTPRGDAMFIQMLGGASRRILDHDALSLLN